MLYLKSAYYYFLSIKINFSKLINKIYFTTTTYNKSLKSKAPNQFYFFPNPFLLSSFISYKKFSFKISNVNPDKFWRNIVTSKEQNNLHSYLWLGLIDRKNDASIIRKIISIWIDINKKYESVIWENSIISKRIISWILNADIVLSGTNHIFKNDFLQSIIIQVNHLKKNINFEKNVGKKIEMLSAILLSGLVFKEYKVNFDLSVKEFEKIIDNYFDKDGFPLTRNPNELLKISKYFILVRECIRDAQLYVPDYLENIIEKNLNCLYNIATPNKKMPLFNGATEISLKDFFNYLLVLKLKAPTTKKMVGGIQVIKYKKDEVFFDVGHPPKKNYSNCYQSGSLSFEYFIDNQKIITNCGFGSNISKKATLISRLTSAQSSLCINNTSLVKFERNKILNITFGNSLKESFEVENINLKITNDDIICSGSHNAYIKNFGYIHNRNIILDKKNNCLTGVDNLIKKKDSTNLSFAIRFHLYPGLDAVQTVGGNSILIKISKNKSLIFSAKNQKISIEKSIFLGGNKILNNLCVTISGSLNSEDKTVIWKIKKNI